MKRSIKDWLFKIVRGKNQFLWSRFHCIPMYYPPSYTFNNLQEMKRDRDRYYRAYGFKDYEDYKQQYNKEIEKWK